MSVIELSRLERKESIQLNPEQEARLRVARVVQQLADLHIRAPLATPAVYVMYGKMPDFRTETQKKTVPYLPRHETYAQDRAGIVSLHFEETPISLYLNIGNVLYPQPQDSFMVEFQRQGNEEVYTMVDGPKLSDGSPAPAETTLTLTDEGQTLIDCIRYAYISYRLMMRFSIG